MASLSYGDEYVAPTAGRGTLPHFDFGYQPSEMQLGFYDWVYNGQGSCNLIAVAGSGKSTSIVSSLLYIPEEAEVKILAFNAKIAKDMAAKIEKLGKEQGRTFKKVSAKTFHSLGYSAVLRRIGANGQQAEVTDSKNRDILKAKLDMVQYSLYGKFCARLVSLAKGEGLGTYLCPATPAEFKRLVHHHDLELDSEDANLDEAVEIAGRLLDYGPKLTMKKHVLDFDDMIYLPILWDLRIWGNDFLFIDEAQDTNPCRRELAKKALKPGGRLIAVGDPCQPPGTMVEVAIKSGRFSIRERKKIPIENIKEGDYVTSFSFADGREYARKVLGITRKSYEGDMIIVEASGIKSRYTTNHRCVVKNTHPGWCTYLMRRGSAYRLGMSRLWYGNDNGVGPWGRLKSEKGDALWILGVHEDKRSAFKEEATLSAYYGVPQLMFTVSENTSVFEQEDLDYIWSGISNERAAIRILKRFKREIAYPYFEKGMKSVSLRRPHDTRACNILPGSLVKLKNGNWSGIDLSREYYYGDVFSLSVEKEELYFADDILTHNCQAIYGFTGASHDAMETIKEEFGCVELPLTVSYRCPKAAGPLVTKLVPRFQVSEAAPEGAVLHMSVKKGLERLSQRDAVICRNTAPLIDLALDLISRGRGCIILGKDIGRGLVALIERMEATGVDDLRDKLEKYAEREINKHILKGEESQAEALSDRVESLLRVIGGLKEGERSVAGLIRKLERMFSDEAGPVLTLCTGHKAKGLEWRRTAILKPELMPSKWARQEHQHQQEKNLQYVCWTRFQEELIFLDGVDVPERRPGEDDETMYGRLAGEELRKDLEDDGLEIPAHLRRVK